MNLFQTVSELLNKRSTAIQNLVAPARAAANQMTDAGMKHGAEPLKAALFELDAIDQQLNDAFRSSSDEETLAMFHQLLNKEGKAE